MPCKDQYTDPDLGDKIKQEIHNGDKGGEAGQWTARKAQMMASEYKKQGGGEKDKDGSQENVTKWDDGEKDSGSNAREKDGKSDTKSSKSNGKSSDKHKDDEDEDAGENQDGEKTGGKRARKDTNESANKAQKQNDTQSAKSSDNKSKGDKDDEDGDEESTHNKKSDTKDKKSFGSRHETKEPTEQKGSADRLPNKADKITWKAMPGYISGNVIEVLTADKEVDGKHVKASEKDPKIVASSDSSGKICVHKPESMYYDQLLVDCNCPGG